MSPSRRSLTTWSSKLAYGDYDTSLVTADLGMLEIGARQLNDWRLHRLPDVLPFYQPGVSFNTPIFSLAATSSLPTTGSVQLPKPKEKQKWQHSKIDFQTNTYALFDDFYRWSFDPGGQALAKQEAAIRDQVCRSEDRSSQEGGDD